MQTALLFTAVFRFVLGGIGRRVSTSLSTSDELTPTEAVVDGCSFRCSQIHNFLLFCTFSLSFSSLSLAFCFFCSSFFAFISSLSYLFFSRSNFLVVISCSASCFFASRKPKKAVDVLANLSSADDENTDLHNDMHDSVMMLCVPSAV